LTHVQLDASKNVSRERELFNSPDYRVDHAQDGAHPGLRPDGHPAIPHDEA
jgi:hypothetical protein